MSYPSAGSKIKAILYQFSLPNKSNHYKVGSGEETKMTIKIIFKNIWSSEIVLKEI